MSQPQPAFQLYLRRYFYSGWAFLIPYLFAYLLYYVTKWPVNAAASAAAGNGSEVIGNGAIEATTHNLSPIASHLGFIPIPCLLHVYWALHAINLVLVGVALWTWLQKAKGERREVIGTERDSNLQPCPPASDVSPITPSASDLLTTDYQLPTTAASPSYLTPDSWLLTSLQRLAPWLLLALLFYIPGVYLEWPSDPWEHLRRINEWRILDTVGAHSSWLKSSYFIPYSLLSWCIGLRQLFWLDFYYTGICLLLCWQYYRFSRACGLGERASMVFVIIQALLFGNNIFSFYRYYGISSSIYAQLGAVALTRIVLEFAARGTKLEAAAKITGFGSCITEGDELGHRGHGVSDPQKMVGQGVPGEPAKGSNSISEKIAKDQWSKTGPEYSTTDRTDKHGSQCLSPIAHHPSPITNTPSAHGEESAPQPCGLNCPAGTQLPPPSASLRASRLTQAARLTISALPCSVNLFITVACLVALTAMNHLQGLGIAGLGIAAVCVWRLIEWKRSALWWLIGGTIIINAIFLWLYPRPAIIETYRTQGYLNAWYGFNILDLSSFAGDRMLQIVSAYGLVNIAAALFLLHRNNVIAWMTLLPLLLMLLPCISIPFANAISSHGDVTNIVTFQRMYFAIPIGLALVYLGRPFIRGSLAKQLINKRRLYEFFAVGILSLVLAAIMIVPNSNSSYNRFWHISMKTANDLQLRDVFSQYETVKSQSPKNYELKITTIKAGTALLTYTPELIIGAGRSRTIGESSIDSAAAVLDFLDFDVITNAIQLGHQVEMVPKSRATGHFNLIADPMASDPAAWCALESYPPEFTYGIVGPNNIATAIQNPAGIQCNLFTSAMIQVQKTKSYRLEMSVKQIRKTDANVYLTVAWFDAQNKLLVSNIRHPLGSGNPRGWVNGTYSYFGLVAQAPSTSWSTFGISFGLGELATVPSNAYYMKVGALLNCNAVPSGVVQITDVKLFEIPTPKIGLAIPSATSVYSPVAQAALLSTHWPPQQVIVDRGGTKEIQSTIELFRSLTEESPIK